MHFRRFAAVDLRVFLPLNEHQFRWFMKKFLFTLLLLANLPGIAAAQPTAISEALPELGPAPLAPDPALVASLPRRFIRPMGLTSDYSVTTTNREESRRLFNAVYSASQNVPLGWTGNINSCLAGDTSAAAKDAILRRINFFRALAGLPSSTTFDASLNAKSQEAALLMSANNNLSHTPPNTWHCYTANAAEAAGNSNLALGNSGPAAIDAYFRDEGSGNAAVGHRRWLLYPQTRVFDTGDVSASGTNYSANALWVFDANYGGPRPAVRDAFVAWPPPGFVPYPVVYNRWSFSQLQTDFSGTTVTVTSNGVPIAAPIETLTSDYGESTIVWRPGNLSANSFQAYAKPAADTVYQVSLTNVVINGVRSNFTYRVTVFDPATKGKDATEPVVSGADTVLAGVPSAFTFNPVPAATAYQDRLSVRTPLTATDGAENGTAGMVLNTANDYAVITNSLRASGSFSWHLAHHSSSAAQYLQVNRLILVRTNAQMLFQSRLGFATSAQFAKVQLSQDGGTSWQDIFSKTGTDSAGDSGFTLQTVSLNNFAGRSVLVRFAYTVTYTLYNSMSYYSGSSTGTGWYIDDISFSNCDELTASALTDLATTAVSVTPVNAGSYALEIRPVVFGAFYLDWGPAKLFAAVVQSKIVTIAAAPGGATLLLKKADNSAFIAGDAAFFQVETSPSLFTPTWSPLNAVPVFSNGFLNVTDPATPLAPTKFYRVLSK